MDRDARRALIHSGTDRRVAHPARQFAQSPWLVLDQNDVDAPAACTFTQAKPPTEQRMPAIFDCREYRFICGMACVLAVDLQYDDGGKAFFVVEPEVALRKLDPESWEPEHALVRAVRGLRAGERFAGPDGREGVVRQIRHKYVARLHYVLEHYETRFPEISGFRQITVDLEHSGGLDGLISQLKARRDWI